MDTRVETGFAAFDAAARGYPARPLPCFPGHAAELSYAQAQVRVADVAGRYGLQCLGDLDRLPATGAVVIQRHIQHRRRCVTLHRIYPCDIRYMIHPSSKEEPK